MIVDEFEMSERPNLLDHSEAAESPPTFLLQTMFDKNTLFNVRTPSPTGHLLETDASLALETSLSTVTVLLFD